MIAPCGPWSKLRRAKQAIILYSTRLRDCQSGVSMLETAFVLPFFITLTFGTIDASIIIQNQHSAHASALYVADIISRKPTTDHITIRKTLTLGQQVIQKHSPADALAFRIVVAGLERNEDNIATIWIGIHDHARSSGTTPATIKSQGLDPCVLHVGASTGKHLTFIIGNVDPHVSIEADAKKTGLDAKVRDLVKIIKHQAEHNSVPNNVIVGFACIESRTILLQKLLPAFNKILSSNLLYRPIRRGSIQPLPPYHPIKH